MAPGNGATATAHYQSCSLHENRRINKCWGTVKKGGLCLNTATCPPVPGVMPTCWIHHRKPKLSGWCKARLPCGFNCGQLLEWEPYGFQLCPRHREYLVTCYFLQVPIEIRCRIYQLLLPDITIPARFSTSASLTTHRGQVYTTILRVNHQIHDEAAGLLYCTNVYSVEVSEGVLTMCNRPCDQTQHVRYHSVRKIKFS